MVSHEKLLKDLEKTTLPDPLKRWFNCYLHGRQSRVKFRGQTSSSRNCKTGVPQGAVSSPILFNFYMSALPTPPDRVKTIQYADDISIYISGTDLDNMTNIMNDYVEKLLAYLKERELEVSPTKSTVTLFTPDTKEANLHPAIYIENLHVKLEKNPVILGVMYDTMYTFSHHIKSTVSKTKKKINILKSLAGSTWGQNKETIINTYKATGRSTLEYAAPIWSPLISDTNWQRLQSCQNQALRAATGCLAMTGTDHLHKECKILPVRIHSEMVTKQFAAACFQNSHPGNKHINLPKPARNLKPTLMRHEDEVAELFRSGSYKENLKKIHTTTVKHTLATYSENRVLQAQAPEIHKEEKTLPRDTRSQLARLRSGFARQLKSYLSRIDQSVRDECPDCGCTPHDTVHLFNCTANPTTLSPLDLWKNPRRCAEFLKLLPEDWYEGSEAAEDPG